MPGKTYGSVGPIGGYEGNVSLGGHNWNYEITSSSGGLNFNTNNLTID
ncbi:hypothetical protein [Streptomyces sp. NPDC057002]